MATLQELMGQLMTQLQAQQGGQSNTPAAGGLQGSINNVAGQLGNPAQSPQSNGFQIDLSKMVNANGQPFTGFGAAPSTSAPAAAPAAAPTGIDALMSDSTQHPGWNPGEAGPPMSPEFVRHPQNMADWQARYQWFTQGENGKTLDPRWRPVNVEYQRNDPNAVGYLARMAANKLNQGEEMAWDWTPQKAQQQLIAWGYGPHGSGTNVQGPPAKDTTTPPPSITQKDWSGGSNYFPVTGNLNGPNGGPMAPANGTAQTQANAASEMKKYYWGKYGIK